MASSHPVRRIPLTLAMALGAVVAPFIVAESADASLPPPDPALQSPPAPTPLSATPSTGQHIHWMLSGAGIALLLAAVVIAAVAAVKRHRLRVRRNRMRQSLGLG